MGALLSVTRLASLALTIVVSVARIVLALVLLPFRILGRILGILFQIGSALLGLFQNARSSLLYFIIGAVVIALGLVAVYETSIVLNAIDAAYECFFAPLFEILYDYAINTAYGLYLFVSAAYNTILEYVIAKGRLLYADLLDVINCVVETGDVFRVLSAPGIIFEFVYNLFYIFSQEARLARRETPLADNFYYPNVMPVLNPYGILGPGERESSSIANAKDQLPGAGAFGPAEDVDPSSLNSYGRMVVRNLWNELVYIVGETGTLATQIASDLQQPAGRFMTSFILRTDVEQSYWRRGFDVLGHVVSFLAGTPFYPLSTNPVSAAQGYSTLKHQVDQIISRSFRILAKVGRLFALVINDMTTYRRPRRRFDGCVPVSDTLNFAERFTGFPVIDIFLVLFEYGIDRTITLNIFKSNYEFCRLHALQYHFWLDAAYLHQLTGFEILQDAYEAYTTHATQCGYLTQRTFEPTTDEFQSTGSISFTAMANYDANNVEYCFACDALLTDYWEVACPMWPGTATPQRNEKIDYLNLALEPVYDFTLLVSDPLNADESLTADLYRSFAVAECFIDHLIHSIIYAVDVAADGGANDACIEATYMHIVNLGIEPCVVRLLDQLAWVVKYVYNGPVVTGLIIPCRFTINVPQSAIDAAPDYYDYGARKNNMFLCLIAKGSIFSGGIFSSICKLLTFEFLGIGPVEFLDCSLSDVSARKRSAPQLTLDEDVSQRNSEVSSVKRTLLIAFLRSVQFAGELRQAAPVIDRCLLDDDSPMAECDTQCSLSPCVAPVIDCLAAHFERNTSLSYAVNERRDVTERAVYTLAVGYDFFYGCEDGELREAAHWSVAVMTMARDMFARFFLFSSKYAPAYEQCMAVADRMRVSTNPLYSAGEIELAYLHCIGAPVPEDAPGARYDEDGDGDVNVTFSEEPEHTRPYFTETLRAAGIDESTVCGAMLLERGFLVDTRIVGEQQELPINALYRFCGTMLAAGARATSSGAASLPLASYINMHRAPLAFTSSTARVNVTEMAEVNPVFALPGHIPRLFAGATSYLPPPTRNDTASNDEANSRARAIVETIGSAATHYATLFELGNYLADLYDRGREGVTAEQLDEFEAERREQAFGIILNLHGDQKAAFERVQKEYAQQRTKQQQAGGNGAVRVNTAFVVDLLRSAVGWRGSTDRGIHYEVQLRHSKGSGEASDYFVRLQRNDDSGEALAPADRPSQWSLVRGEMLAAVLNGTAHRRYDARASEAQAAHEAMKALTMRPRGIQETYDGMMKVAKVGRIVLSTVFRIVNRRLRLESLPPVQAAVMTLETLVNGNVDEMQAWSSGDLGYVVGTGFVPLQQYDSYMLEQQALREDALSLYSTHLSEEGIHSAPVFSRRYVERRHKAKMLALAAGDASARNAGSRLFERVARRSRSRRHTHESRSRFYLRHGLEHSDEHFDKFLPLHHPLLAAARRASGVYERAALHAMAASNSEASELPVVVFFQMILDFLGIDYCIADLLDDLQELGERIWEAIYAEFADFDQKIDDFIERNMCDGPEAYRLNGTETYTIGCIPFLPEDAFEWLKPFPGPLRNPPLPQEDSDLDNLFRLLIGPGYILWPEEMIEEGCPVERAPEDQCPIPPPFLWAPYIDAEPGDRPPISEETVNAVVCLTNFCPVYGDSNPSDFPLCPFGCDYCVRDYFSASEFGFNDGFDVLGVYFRLYRAFIDLLFDWPNNGSGLTCGLLFYPFFVYMLLPYLPLSSVVRVALLLMPAVDAFYFLRPERLFFVLYPLFALYEALPFVAIGIWLAALAPCYADIITGQPYDSSGIVAFFQWFAPDFLLLQLLEFLQSISFLAFFFDVTTFDSVIDALRDNVEAGDPTVAESIYALLSVMLAVLTVVGIVLGFILLYNLLTIIGPVFDAIATVVSSLLDILRAVSNYLLRARVRALVDDVEDLTDDALGRDLRQDRRLDEIEEELIRDERDETQLRRRVQAIGRYGN